MKVILCGYHWAGCRALELLLEAGHEVFVFSHGSPWHVPSLRDYCGRLGVKCSTEDISQSELPFKPDVIASVYYRH
ncbi:unnamed protein product, partial [marine sediment metagenome]